MSSITEGITYVEPAELVAAIEGKRAGTVSDSTRITFSSFILFLHFRMKMCLQTSLL